MPAQEVERCRLAALAVLDSAAGGLEPLWGELSAAAAAVEEALRAARGDGEAARVGGACG